MLVTEAASMLAFVSQRPQVEKVSSDRSSSSMALAAMAGAKPSFKGSLEKDQQAHLASLCVLTMAVRH